MNFVIWQYKKKKRACFFPPYQTGNMFMTFNAKYVIVRLIAYIF